MKDVVYKFLDEYIGDEFVFCSLGPPVGTWIKAISKKGVDRELITFACDGDEVKINIISAETIKVISDYCCISTRESNLYIKGWIKDRLKIDNPQDLIRFIPKEN
jgi:hypothetical protein